MRYKGKVVQCNYDLKFSIIVSKQLSNKSILLKHEILNGQRIELDKIVEFDFEIKETGMIAKDVIVL